MSVTLVSWLAEVETSPQAMPGVTVESLLPWRMSAYNMTLESHDVKTFRGYFCKIGAALAAERFDLVAIVDLDAILFEDPFALAEWAPFRQSGGVFFRERRLIKTSPIPNASVEHNRQVLGDIWHRLTGEAPEKLPSAIKEEPIYSGWSMHTVESAVQLYDRRQTRAVEILKFLAGPDMIQYTGSITWGDEDFLWLSLGLAGLPVSISPVLPGNIGDQKKDDDRGEVLTCDVHVAYLQYLPWTNITQPQFFYVNGVAVEKYLQTGDKWLIDDTFLARAMTYAEGVELNIPDDFCQLGSQKLPSQVRDRLLYYKQVYDEYDTNTTDSRRKNIL